MDILKHTQKYWKNYVIGFLLVIIVISALGILSTSFQSMSSSFDSRAESMIAQQDIMRSSYFPGSGSNAAPQEEERMIAKNANLRVETDSYHESIRKVESLSESHSAIVMSQSENKYNSNYYRAQYSFKVESSKLDTFLDDLQELGELESIIVYSNDVTGVVIDLEKRLERYSAQMSRYEEMLTRGELTIEDEINIQNRIDSLEQTMSYLQESIQRQEEDVSYSDVSFSLTQKQSLFDELDFLGLKEGLKLFLASLEFGIRFAVSIVGFIIPIALMYGAYIIGRRVVK